MQQQLFNFKKGGTSKMEEEQIKAKPQALLPWVEKYRPDKISEISFQDDITLALDGVLQTGQLPHLLLHGPPGTGKTSSILALAKQLYGPTFYKKRILELNASDDRGISVVREKIKKFAQQVVMKNPDSSYKCPPFKIIILDEADSMTTDAQSALRRIIEDNSGTTRFCIICNYITKIIEPLASRCIKFRFKPVSREAQIIKLESIAEAENMTYDKESIEGLIEISGGDLRKSVNYLQSASQLYNKTITQQCIVNISGTVPDSVVQKLVKVIIEGGLGQINAVNKEILAEGYSPEQIMGQLGEAIVYCTHTDLTEIKKARILEKIAYSDKCLNEGADNELQLFNVLSSAYSIVSNKDFHPKN